MSDDDLNGLNIRNTKNPLDGEIFFVEDLPLTQEENND